MKAKSHPEERKRLASLHRFGILDTPRETSFDEIVELAAAICETPVSQINFIDTNRQWSKAEIGVGVCEIPLEVSICAHAILSEEFVEIPDMLIDARTSDNPVCLAGPKVRFYAGVQLKSATGLPIGTLCVIDTKPRTLNSVQRQAMRVLAAQIVSLLDLRTALAHAAMLRNEIDHRVKNSLQAISAFVSLERRYSDNPDAQSALQSVEQQINTIALIHDLLSQSVSDENIALDAYLGAVIKLLDRATPRNIAVTGTLAPVTMTAQSAGLIGLILNELVANAVKHSFEKTIGQIAISGERTGDLSYTIICQDNGRTPPAAGGQSASSEKREGLGLAIVQNSVLQLNGTIAVSTTDQGYQTRITFPTLN